MRRRPQSNWLMPLALAMFWMLGWGADRAEAYLDPGTGGALISMLGVLLGVFALGFSVLRRACSGWWATLTGRGETAPEQSEADSEE